MLDPVLANTLQFLLKEVSDSPLAATPAQFVGILAIPIWFADYFRATNWARRKWIRGTLPSLQQIFAYSIN